MPIDFPSVDLDFLPPEVGFPSAGALKSIGWLCFPSPHGSSVRSGRIAREQLDLLHLRPAQLGDLDRVRAEQRTQVVEKGRSDVVASGVDEMVLHHPRLAGDRL